MNRSLFRGSFCLLLASLVPGSSGTLRLKQRSNEVGEDFRIDSTNDNQAFCVTKDASFRLQDSAKLSFLRSSRMLIRNGSLSMKGNAYFLLFPGSYSSLSHTMLVNGGVKVGNLASLSTYCHYPPCFFTMDRGSRLEIFMQGSFTTIGNVTMKGNSRISFSAQARWFDQGAVTVARKSSILLGKKAVVENFGNVVVKGGATLKLDERSELGMPRQTSLEVNGDLTIGEGATLLLMYGAELVIEANKTVIIEELSKLTIEKNNVCYILQSMRVKTLSLFSFGHNSTEPGGVLCFPRVPDDKDE